MNCLKNCSGNRYGRNRCVVIMRCSGERFRSRTFPAGLLFTASKMRRLCELFNEIKLWCRKNTLFKG